MEAIINFDDLIYEDGTVEDLTQELNQAFSRTNEGRPHRIVIDSEHATMIEFGTNGSDRIVTHAPKGKGKPESQWSETAKAIKKWMETRSDGSATSDEIYLVFRKIMEQGSPPQPFIRPAIHEVEMLLDTTDTFKDLSVKDIMEYAKTRMIQYLQENYTLYSGGSFADKIYVEDADNIDLPNDIFIENIPQEIWDSDYADLKGNEDRAKEREQNKNKLRFRS